MAKLPALVSAMTTVDNRDRKSIDHVARVIREAGHISTGKRGAGAAEMTARDAANLIIAITASATPADGPQSVDRYRKLEHRVTAAGTDPEGPLAKAFEKVAVAKTFGRALETLIETVPLWTDAFRRHAIDKGHFADGGEAEVLLFAALRERAMGVDVSFQPHGAEIEVYRAPGPDRATLFDLRYRPSPAAAKRWTDASDRSIVISNRTLIAAWSVLHGKLSTAGCDTGLGNRYGNVR